MSPRIALAAALHAHVLAGGLARERHAVHAERRARRFEDPGEQARAGGGRGWWGGEGVSRQTPRTWRTKRPRHSTPKTPPAPAPQMTPTQIHTHHPPSTSRKEYRLRSNPQEKKDYAPQTTRADARGALTLHPPRRITPHANGRREKVASARAPAGRQTLTHAKITATPPSTAGRHAQGIRPPPPERDRIKGEGWGR
ncbi:hypothetical protein DFH09DRAFT_1081718 [Mycena vulgaris]|nr:hypothetical protein DFH09DRAFT_1081718 [Mycena vulgaris]